MKLNKSTIFVSIGLLVLFLLLDQWTKWAIVETIPLFDEIEIIPHFFSLTYIQNTGAGFSILEDSGVLFFSLVTVISLAVILYFYFICDDQRIQICLSFVFSGALGNWIDRLRFGYVRDFFSFRILGHPFPVFNIADICITIGFFCIVLVLFIDDWKVKKLWKKSNGS